MEVLGDLLSLRTVEAGIETDYREMEYLPWRILWFCRFGFKLNPLTLRIECCSVGCRLDGFVMSDLNWCDSCVGPLLCNNRTKAREMDYVFGIKSGNKS